MMMAFVARAPTPVTRLKLVKWLFIAANDHGAASQLPFYDFVPYQYGPFSFAAYHELAGLTARGFLDQRAQTIAVAAKRRLDDAVGLLARGASQIVDDVLREWGRVGRTVLIDRVYEKHPWFASRSKLRPRTESVTAPLAVYTSGYEGISIDAFLNRLLKRGVRRVIDVRKNAYSRKYGFTGGVFRSVCMNVGIDYVHVPQLGVPSKLRNDLDAPGARAALFTHYRTEIVPAQSSAQERVAALMKERPSTLVCFEANSADCHRGSLAPFIGEATGLPLIHL